MRLSATRAAAIAQSRGLGNLLWDLAGAPPSLDLRFAENKSLVDATTGASLVTFTRASSATYVDSQGVIQTASTDVPRFDHNPVTGESLGLLVEEQRTNLMTLSEDFSNSIVFRGAVTANAATAPDGAATADLFTESTETGNHIVQAPSNIAFSSGTTYTYTIFLKPNGRTSIRVNANQTATWPVDATFNLTGTGSVSTTLGTCSIQQLANEWYRCVLTAAATASATTIVSHRTSSGDGDGTSGIYLWGAQLEAGAFPTSYIPTTTAAATRSADVASISGSNFSSWYRQDEGTFYTQQRTDATDSRQGAYMVQAGTQQGRGIAASIDTRNAAQRLATSIRDDVSLGQVNRGGLVDNDLQSIGHSWSDGATTAALNGGTAEGTYNAIYPGLDTLHIGYNVISAGSPIYLGGRIKRLTFWPQRFDASVLQAITQ
jgi:hypothetical protein